MMTLEDIKNLPKIDLTIAKEAHAQADRRLADTLETRKMFEQKAITLFSAYIALTLALFGIAGSFHSRPFLAAGLLTIVGAILFVIALMDATCGALGSDPAMWLTKGTIDADEGVLPWMLAYITHHHKERIDRSTQENNRKARLIRWGLIAGVAAPIVLVASMQF